MEKKRLKLRKQASAINQSMNQSPLQRLSSQTQKLSFSIDRFVRRQWDGRKEGKYPPIHRTDPKKWKIRKADPEHELFFLYYFLFRR
ncbi:hypothetical protein HOY82DRAFT_135236 [Tuber indicum]|nr:hypothetical protein HOY82DRAFT_135236 [Tuber indicum]